MTTNSIKDELLGNTSKFVAAPNRPAIKNDHLVRYPFVILIDASASTGQEPDPDINHINTAIGQILGKLRQPTPKSDLADNIDNIDLLIVAYSEDPVVVADWMSSDTPFPAQVQTLTPILGTMTGRALTFSLNKIGERLRFYHQHKLAFGLPHIFHITDGAPTDLTPGTPIWDKLKAKLVTLGVNDTSESKDAALIHMVTPKGTLSTWNKVNGVDLSGLDLMREFSGKNSVVELDQGIELFEQLVKLIVVTISQITKGFGTQQAVDGGNAARKGKMNDQTEYF